MKKIILIITLIIAAFIAYKYNFAVKPKVLAEETAVTPTPAIFKNLKYKNLSTAYSYIKDINPERISLIPNFKDQKSSKEIMDKDQCKYGVNAGFYSTENTPLGLFRIGKDTLQREKKSRTFDGFISITCGNENTICRFNINAQSTKNPTVYQIQTGPVIIREQTVIALSLEQDKPARRMVMAKDIFGKVIIMSVFDPEARLSGPTLTDLPEIVNAISKNENLGITDAVNLDGGSASAFYGNNLILNEINPIGSWWCIK